MRQTTLLVIYWKDDQFGEKRPVAFGGKKLHKSELNYSTTEKECLAVAEALKAYVSTIPVWKSVRSVYGSIISEMAVDSLSEMAVDSLSEMAVDSNERT